MAIHIKEFLRRTRMTQYSLADKLGCNQSLVAAWSTGKGQPTYDKICLLIELGITPDELFGPELSKKLTNENTGKSDSKPDLFKDRDFVQGVLDELIELKAKNIINVELSKAVKEMKENGKL